MLVNEVLEALSALSTDRAKKYYTSQGVKGEFFGVPTGAMKPLAKAHMKNQALAEDLYATGNFDAMYLAGIIADPKAMVPEDFWRWIAAADSFMVADFIVAVTLSETSFAMAVADAFIASEGEFARSAGWSCYEWLLGSKKDDYFDIDHIESLLQRMAAEVHMAPDYTKRAMNRCLVAIGVSYKPLHERAIAVAEAIGPIEVADGAKRKHLPRADETIQKETAKGRLGFKRKYVRC